MPELITMTFTRDDLQLILEAVEVQVDGAEAEGEEQVETEDYRALAASIRAAMSR